MAIEMRVEGRVSLWIGTVDSDARLKQAFDMDSTEDGDWLGSEFSRAFDIHRYEPMRVEAVRRDPQPATLTAALARVSYAERLVPRLEALRRTLPERWNTFVLMYDIEASGPTRWDTDGIRLEQFGVVSYL